MGQRSSFLKKELTFQLMGYFFNHSTPKVDNFACHPLIFEVHLSKILHLTILTP
jgi:hypothetical protein